MISHNPDSNCTNARLYYYDFLSEETREGIPEGALQHIKKCRICQSEMDSLKELLENADERLQSEQSRKDSAISTLLRLHFEYTGEPVTCQTVKPFLGSLVDPVLQIKIPTPITTHVNKCKACRDDLIKLLDLQLPHKYLCRLGQLLAEKPVEDEFSCSQVQAAIPAVLSMPFGETNAEILKHLCTCSDCRQQLYLHRESICKELLHNGPPQNGFPCDSVSAADIYDYCLPYGIDPADDEYIESRESLASHLHKCPKCLTKIQELHRTISNIAERVESGVVTIFDVDEIVETNSYIKPVASADIAARLREKTTALNLKPLLKIGLAAAAVIAIGFALLFNSPAAKAVTLDQVYRAVEIVRNIYIAKYGPDKAEPTQEMWVSRSLNIYMFTNTSEGLVLWDANKKQKKTKQTHRASSELKMLSDEDCTKIEATIAGYLDLLPFSSLSNVPEDADWSPEYDDSLRVTEEKQEVYKLTWADKTYGGVPVFRKRLYFVDPETGLPNKIKCYRKLSASDEYSLQTEMVVQRLRDDEIQAKAKDLFP